MVTRCDWNSLTLTSPQSNHTKLIPITSRRAFRAVDRPSASRTASGRVMPSTSKSPRQRLAWVWGSSESSAERRSLQLDGMLRTTLPTISPRRCHRCMRMQLGMHWLR